MNFNVFLDDGQQCEAENLDDSLVFVQEYIDLDGPERADDDVKPLLQSFSNDVKIENVAIARPPVPIKLETSGQNNTLEREFDLLQENNSSSIAPADDVKPAIVPADDVKPDIVPAVMPSIARPPMPIQPRMEPVIEQANFGESNEMVPAEADMGQENRASKSTKDESMEYFGDGSTTSTDFESPPDRTEDLIRLYRNKGGVKKLDF